VFWTLPDIGVALLCLSIVPIVVGMLKLSRRVAQRSPGARRVTLEGRPVQSLEASVELVTPVDLTLSVCRHRVRGRGELDLDDLPAAMPLGGAVTGPDE
jgi:hypothetical protein